MDDIEALAKAVKLVWQMLPQEAREEGLRTLSDEDAEQVLKAMEKW